MYITAICSRYEQVQVIEGGVSRLPMPVPAVCCKQRTYEQIGM